MFILNDGSLICLFVCGYGIIHHCYSVYVYIFVYLIDIIFDCCCFYLFLTICREKKNFNKFVTTDQMSINLFYTFLLLVFITCCACQCVYAKEITSTGGSKKVELFKTNEPINNIIKPDNGETKSGGENITPSAFYLPLIVAADDVMVALTGVNRTDSDSDKHVDILTKYITTEGDDWSSKVTNDEAEGNGWKTQFAVKEKNDQQRKYVVKGLAAAAKGDKMYLLLLNETEGDCGSDQNCGIKLAVGTLSEDTNKAGKIKWEAKNDVGKSFTDELKSCLVEVPARKYLSASSVYLEAKKEIVFVVHVTKNDKNKFVFAFLADTTESNEKLSCMGKTESSCISAFFSWEGKIMMVPTHCDENIKTNLFVNESSDMGKTWTESKKPFGRLLNFLKNKKDFTTITVENVPVVLFTQQKPKATQSGGQQSKYDVHVWFTDGNRVSTAGRIVTDDNITSSNLLHTKGELFGLYQNISDNKPGNITLQRMETQLKNITAVLTAWKNSDNTVQGLFKSILTTSSESYSITDGLVGFLSDKRVGNNWIDEYYYSNATVSEGNKVLNGLKFDGKKNGAKWPVGKPKDDLPYNFTDFGFTLVANVTIDTADKDNSVLGVGYNKENNGKNETKNIGLRCTAKNEWGLTDSDESPKPTVTNGEKCQQGSTYLVALLLSQNKLSVYIDGVQIDKNKIQVEQSANITHFYFGAENDALESHVTVTNVLLYNRPFAESEVTALKIAKKDDVAQTPENDNGEDTPRDNGSNTHGGSGISKDRDGDEGSASQSSRSGKVEKESTSQPESSTVRGSYVGVFVCFVMLAHRLRFL